jgi:hypothetical protein
MKRGMTYLGALSYVGVKRRTFDMHWRPHLVAIPQETSLIFDREDLDRLFERFKRDNASRLGASTTQLQAVSDDEPGHTVPTLVTTAAIFCSEDRRPASEKEVQKWVVKTASTKTQMEDGGSTNSTAVNAFRVVSNRIRKPQLG